jgi:hypothetical protein
MASMKTKNESLTDQLRRYVVESGQSLGELSQATGLHVSALSRFLHGERGVTTKGLDALGKHLGLHLARDRKSKSR